MANIAPITPSDVEDHKSASIPDEVFEAFNELIAREYDGHSATVVFKKVVTVAVSKMRQAGKRVSRQGAIDKGWFDVEPAYRKAGWNVEFDKAGYCEDYDSFYTFSKKG